MRRFVVPLAAVAVLGLVAWLLFFQNTDTDRSLAPLAAEVVAQRGPAAADRIDQDPLARAESLGPEFTNRPIKVGAGRFGLHGIVVDENGDSVPGAWVAAYSSPFPLLDFEFQIAEIFEKPLDFSLEPLASVFADDEGLFQLQGVPGRTTYLTARTVGRLTPRRQRVLPDELDGEKGVIVRTVAGATLEGRVVDAQGRPAAGAEVLVGPGLKYLIAAFRNRTFFMERALTDADGRFQIEAVPARMALMANAFQPVVRNGIEEFGPLAAGSTGNVNVQLAAMGGLSGVVLDSKDEGVRGATVVAVPLDLRRALPFIRDIPAWTRTTGSDGSYAFPELPRNNYMLFAQAREGRAAPVSTAVVGEAAAAPDIVIQEQTIVTGRVVDGKGKPVADALVKVQSIPAGELKKTGEERARSMAQGGFILEAAQEILPELLPSSTWDRTDARGNFRIPAWQNARVRVEARGFPVADFQLPGSDEGLKPVLVLRKPGSLEGLVIDSGAGKPVQFYLVRGNFRNQKGDEVKAALAETLAEDEVAVTPRSSWRAEVAASYLCDTKDGRFLLENLPAGEWQLTVQAEGYAPGESDRLQVEPGEATRGVVITLGRGATISGQVIAKATGEGVEGAVITVGHGEESGFVAMLQGLDQSTAMGETDEQGFFRVTGAREGADHVNALSEGYAAASVEVPPLQAHEEREEILVELAMGGTITGTVTDRHGATLPGRMVGAMSIQAKDFQQTATNADGAFRMEHMRPGSYFMITAGLDDDSLFSGDLMSVLTSSRILTAYVTEGEITLVDIVDQSAGGCRLRGRLVRNGQPVPDANLAAMASETSGLFDFRFATARSDELGEFEFKNLAPGEYVLNVETRGWDGQFEIAVPDYPEDFQILEVPRTEIHGRVVAEASGAPVAGASVQLIREDGLANSLTSMFGGGTSRKFANSDQEGVFLFEGVAEGRYHLEVRGQGLPFRGRGRVGLEPVAAGPPLGRVRTASFELGRNERKNLNLVKLPLAGSIKVIAEDGRGAAFEGALSVSSKPLDGGAQAGEEDSPFANRGWGRGSATVSSLQPGNYSVTVESEGFAAQTIGGIVVVGGETTEVRVTLARGATLSARVLDANNRPVASADVAVLNRDGRKVNREAGFGGAFTRLFTGSGDGAQPLGTFPPGTYTVRATWQDRTVDTTVTLLEGAEETVTLRF
ncbi:MAG TPA: carboxypeptidase regulatory-like domain-containing protein [Planctomycetota bacterium]